MCFQVRSVECYFHWTQILYNCLRVFEIIMTIEFYFVDIISILYDVFFIIKIKNKIKKIPRF